MAAAQWAMNQLRWSTTDVWEWFYSWLRSTANIANYKRWLRVVGGIIFYIIVNDNIWLAMTTDKQIGFRKTFVNKHWIKDEVFTAISSLVYDFLTYNANCCEGQHIAGISTAKAVKNRVYFWQMQGVVALCESFPNVNPALVPNKAEPRI